MLGASSDDLMLRFQQIVRHRMVLVGSFLKKFQEGLKAGGDTGD